MKSFSTDNTGLRLPVAEDFYSVQGEGANAGKAAYFIRLAGCDVHCPFCDSKNTWNTDGKTVMHIDSIATRASSSASKNVVITGGEPLMHNLEPLCKALKDKGLSIWLETSGTHPISGMFDWICVSPKASRPPLDEVLDVADELKAIITDAGSFDFAEQCALKVPKRCSLTLQAEWDNRAAVYPLIFDYVLGHPEWKISIQAHKILNIR